jgi:GDP/UDP-N,N'-diacetylbacillosamine 2-epimerase (hydrolysing)
MGERPDRVFVTGAPGLENLSQLAHRSREELCAALGFDSKQKIALVVFHPVLQESNDAERQMEHLMRAASAERLQMLCLEPNADAGAGGIRLVLDRYRAQRNVRILTHLSRPDFISWMAAADIMVGNSSSGIIEAASFGLPVVNVGTRQQFRERNANVTDAPADYEPIRSAIALTLSRSRPQPGNAYGGDDVSGRIVELLGGLPLGPELLFKSNAY